MRGTGARRVRVLPVALLALACLTLPARADVEGPHRFNGQTVPHGTGRDFRLPDVSGTMRTLASFRGKLVLMFFGFANCPDVCPTELSRLAEVTRLLGADASRVQVVFVTLDPERDTPEFLQQYVAAFSPDFLALRGDEATTAEIARTFQVFYRRLEGSAPGRYTLEHSAYVHAIDPNGNLRLRLTGDMSVEEIVADLRALLAGG